MFFFFKQKTAYEVGTGDWSSDVCSSDLVVVVTESNPLRQGYFIARVKNVYPSKDGIVRRVDICYRNFRVGRKVHEYKGSTEIVVSRGVKNLALLVGMDELWLPRVSALVVIGCREQN